MISRWSPTPSVARFSRMPDSDDTLDKEALEAGFRVGDVLVEPLLQRVTRDDEPVQIEPRVMEVLVRLAEQPGRPVSKGEFLDDLWEGVYVTDDALLRCIGELRRTFGDDARNPRYIETIRKRGYRLIAPVELAPVSLTPPPEESPEAVPELAAAAPPPEGTVETVAPAAPVGLVAEAPPERSSVMRTVLVVGAGLIVVLVAVGLWFGRAPEPEALVPVPLRAVPLTSYPGIERDPHLSPDGATVAFVWDGGDGGSDDLYVQQIGVGTPLRLTETPEDEASPAWSPDGQRVAFVRGGDIFSVPVIGGAERRLAGLGGRAVREIVWSPDGETLAVSAETETGGPFGIWLLPTATFQPHPLTTPPAGSEGDFHPAFSPDGRRLAFARSTTERVDDVYLLPLGRANELKRLTFDHAEVTGLDWTRDGGRVVFSSDRGGGSALWVVPAEGGTPVWVPTSGEGRGAYQPTLARESGQLAFVQREEEANLWAVPLDPAAIAPDRPAIASTRWDSHPALSADGRRVAFVSNRTGAYEVWVSGAAGTDPYPVTELGGPFVTTPRWDPQGRRIAFVAKVEGSADIYVVDAAGGQPRRITTAESNEMAPAWSRDGRTLYFASSRSGRWEVWKRSADASSDPVQVTDDGAFAAQESPDGRTLYTTRRGTTGLWQRPVSGGEPVLVDPALQPADWANWSVTAAGVYTVRRDAGGAALYLRDPVTGGSARVAGLDRFPEHPALAVSADGRRAVATRLDRSNSDLLLVEDFD